MLKVLPKLSPELFRRVDLLNGCQGHWLLIRGGEPEVDCSHQWHQSPDEPLKACLEDKWRNLSLGFAPSYCGYSDYSSTGLVGLANFNCLSDPASTPDPFNGVLEVGYGWNGRGIVVDLRFAPFEVLESIAALEDYPLISDEEYSQLECDGIAKLWGEDSVADRVQTLQDLDLCIFAARRDSAPWELDRLRGSLIEQLNSYPTIAA
jgi:hypothetical protein